MRNIYIVIFVMKKKIFYRIWIIMVVIWLLSFSDWSFAVESEWAIKGLTIGSHMLLAIASWIWVLFAKAAWTLLTNSWVYGEELHLDVILWTYWNMVKNFANFGLWFYFVYKIFSWMIKQWKESIAKNLKKEVLWLLIAWVGIQISWFLTAVVIDLSTVTLAAAGAFPSQITSENDKIEENLKKSLSKISAWKKITLFPVDAKASNFTEVKEKTPDGSIDFDKLLDEIMPNSKDVAWPLYYIWYTILKIDHVPSIDTSSIKWIEATLLNDFIYLSTTLVYCLEMFVLCVLALMRMIYLWMFIVLSPMVVLLTCLKYSGWIDKKSDFLSSFTNQLNLKTFFVNVFKPTIIVLWLWISVIFVTQMNEVIENYTWKTLDVRWTQMSDTRESTDNVNDNLWDERYRTDINNNMLSFSLLSIWKTLLEVALSLLTVMIVYFVLKFATSFGWWSDFVSKKISGLQSSVWKIAGSIPLVPVPWYDSQWVETTRFIGASDFLGLKKGETPLFAQVVNEYSNKKIKKEKNRQEDIINSWIGKKTGRLSGDEESKIGSIISAGSWLSSLTSVKQAIDNMKTDEWKWMTLNKDTASNQGFWIKQFENWLEKSKDQRISWTWNDDAWNEMIRRWNEGDNKNQGLEQMFKQNEAKNVEAYAKFFGLSLSSNTWEELKKADISKKS